MKHAGSFMCFPLLGTAWPLSNKLKSSVFCEKKVFFPEDELSLPAGRFAGFVC